MLNVQALISALPIMGKGLGGVFFVIAVVYLAIMVMRKISAKKEHKV